MKINKLFLLSILSCSLLSAMKKYDGDQSPKRKRDEELSKSLVKKVKVDKGKEHISEDNLEDTENYDLINYFSNLPDELILKIGNYVFYDETFKKAFKNYINFRLTDKKLYFTLNDRLFKKEQFFKLANFFPPHNISQKLDVKLSSKSKKILLKKLIEKYNYKELDLTDWLNNNKGKSIFDLVKTKSDDSIIGALALLNSGIDVNGFDKDHTPLTLAAMKDNKALLELLIYAGADPNLRSKKNKYAALVLEADRGIKRQDSVRFLLEAGADPNIQNKDGDTPLLKAIDRLRYKNKHDIPSDRVTSLINAGADVNIANNKGTTPLIEAIGVNNLELVKKLLSLGAEIEIANNKGETPLIEAIKVNNLELVKKLVSVGAEIDKADKKGKRPLSYAVFNMYHSSKLNTDIVIFLISKGAKIDSIDKKGSTPLHYPSELLYNRLSDLHSWDGKEGYKSIINPLIAAGLSINAQNKQGLTPLMSFVKKRKCEDSIIEFIRKLFENGADINLTDNEGKTALMHTTSKENINLLIDYGAEIDKRCNNGKTALIYLAASELLYITDVFIALLNKGADVNLYDNEGKTALMHVASDPEYVGVRAKALLEKKADLDLKDNTGKTTLMYAAASDKVRLVKMLISAGANLLLKDNEGKTAADYATNEEIKKLLSS